MQLERKRRIVDDHLIIHQLGTRAIVPRDDAGDAGVGLDRRRRTHADRVSDSDAALDELDVSASHLH